MNLQGGIVKDIITVERSLLKSKAFRGLSGTAKTVLLDFLMKRKLKKLNIRQGRKPEWCISNNGEIEYTYSEAENKKPVISRGSFMRALDSLTQHGFIDVEHSGSGGKKGDKSLYAISDRWRLWGTDEFISSKRKKDTRSGRGFKPGSQHWNWKGQRCVST
jgi:hypothetical protein